MQSYETSTTVGEEGKVTLAVPFAPGTKIEVTVVPAQLDSQAAAERAERLFAAMNKSRNTESVGPLRRDELYDRDILR